MGVWSGLLLLYLSALLFAKFTLKFNDDGVSDVLGIDSCELSCFKNIRLKFIL